MTIDELKFYEPVIGRKNLFYVEFPEDIGELLVLKTSLPEEFDTMVEMEFGNYLDHNRISTFQKVFDMSKKRVESVKIHLLDNNGRDFVVYTLYECLFSKPHFNVVLDSTSTECLPNLKSMVYFNNYTISFPEKNN